MTIISKQCKLNRHLSSTFSAHLWICLGHFAVVRETTAKGLLLGRFAAI